MTRSSKAAGAGWCEGGLGGIATAALAAAAALAVGESAEDHPAGAGLQGAGDDELDLLVEVLPPVLDHNHRAVLKIANTLAGFLAGFNNTDGHLFARQHDGF